MTSFERRPVCQAGPVSTTPPAGDSAPTPALPASARVAVVVMAVLAVLLLANAALLWFGFDAVVDRIVDEDGDVTREEVEGQVVFLSLLPNLLLGAVLAAAAVFLPRRRTWALWAGVAATGLLVLFTLFFAVLAGGITVTSLLLLVLSVAGVTSLVARTTRDWVRGTAGPAG